jgi:hypothetical protein
MATLNLPNIACDRAGCSAADSPNAVCFPGVAGHRYDKVI